MAKEFQTKYLNFSSKDLDNFSQFVESYNASLSRQLSQSDFSKIAKNISQNLARQNTVGITIGEELRKLLENGNFLKNINAFEGLGRITPPNFPIENFAKQIADFTLGSQLLATNLNILSKNIADHLDNFNPLSIGIKEINESLYKQINRKNIQFELESITEINQEFVEEIEYSGTEQITDITELRDSLIDKLYVIYEKAKTEIGKEYIWRLMSLISLVLTIYSVKNPTQQTIIHTKEIVKESEKGLLKIESKLDSLGKQLETRNQLRIATTDVNLRFKNKKRSEKIGLVKSGQIVIVLKIKHKWLYVSYVDNDGEVHFGYVYKKYFDTI